MHTKVPFIEAMASQPEQLAHTLELLRGQLDRADLPSWDDRDTIGIIAMGASSHSGLAAVDQLARHGRRGVNVTASALVDAAPGFQPADHYLIVSESGRSPEPLDAARSFTRGRRIGITNNGTEAIADVVDTTLDLGGFADSGVYTIGFTATLLAYAVLFDRMGAAPLSADIERLPESVATQLQRTDDADALAALVAGARSIDVVGSGVSFASASELALMIREGLRIPASAFETFQYLHGPMESTEASDLVIVLGETREADVAAALSVAGRQVVHLTTQPYEDDLVRVVSLPEVDGFARCALEVVFGQLILVAAARLKPYPIEEFVFTDLGTKVPPVGADG